MSIHVEISDTVLKAPGPEISRLVLETVALEGFKAGQLSTAQVKSLLGFESRFEVHEFLAKNNVPWVDYSIDAAEREGERLKELLNR